MVIRSRLRVTQGIRNPHQTISPGPPQLYLSSSNRFMLKENVFYNFLTSYTCLASWTWSWLYLLSYSFWPLTQYRIILTIIDFTSPSAPLTRLNQCFRSGSAWIHIKICLRIRIQEVKKPRKCSGSVGEYRTGYIKARKHKSTGTKKHGSFCNTFCSLIFNRVLMSSLTILLKIWWYKLPFLIFTPLGSGFE